jgi:hypothetical protein
MKVKTYDKKRINIYLSKKWFDYLSDYCKRNGLNMTTAMHFALMELKKVDDEEFYMSKRDLVEAVDEVREAVKEIKREVNG